MKRNPLIRMREMYDSLSNSEKTVAKYILEDPSLVMQHNIRELAARLYVSPATVVRLSQTLGFKGYREFKQAMVYGLAQYENNGKEHLSDIGRQDTIQEIAEKITYQNTKSLEETLSFLDVEVIQKCVEHLCQCRQVLLFGMGASLCVAKDASLKFLRVNKSCFVMDDWHSQYLLAQNSTSEDFAIIFSYSGETSEMIKCAKRTICCTPPRERHCSAGAPAPPVSPSLTLWTFSIPPMSTPTMKHSWEDSTKLTSQKSSSRNKKSSALGNLPKRTVGKQGS